MAAEQINVCRACASLEVAATIPSGFLEKRHVSIVRTLGEFYGAGAIGACLHCRNCRTEFLLQNQNFKWASQSCRNLYSLRILHCVSSVHVYLLLLSCFHCYYFCFWRPTQLTTRTKLLHTD